MHQRTHALCAMARFLAVLPLALWTGLILIPDLAGPNSGHLGKASTRLSMFAEVRSEGSPLPMERGGGSLPSDAQHMFLPKTHGSGPMQPLGAKTQGLFAAKRSLRRAHRRAEKSGWAFYKGHLLTSAQIDQAVETGHINLTALQHPPRARHPGPRASIFSWNTGGLSSESYRDLMHWLEIQQIDIVLLQGTRWKGERLWQAHGYFVIQAGEPETKSQAYGGLITMVSQRLCNADALSYATAIEGRVQHVRCSLGDKCLDIVNVYQFPDTCSKDRKDPIASRLQVWKAMDQLLHSLAHRNVLIWGGDFNCSLPGHGTPPANLQADFREFEGLLRKYHLHTMRTHDGHPTFVGPQGSSTIDFLFQRRQQMDGPAHEGRCLREFPVASWRLGIDHRPLIASTSLAWKCWFARRPPATRLNRPTKEAMHHAWSSQTPTWHSFATQLLADCDQLPPKIEALCDFAPHAIAQAASIFRPRRPQKPPAQQTSIVAQLWQHYGALRNAQSCEISTLFRIWTHYTKVIQLKRQLTKSCKELKKARLQNAVRDAELAAQAHDTRKLFQIIRDLTPKMPFRQIRFRGPQGEALSAHGECEMLEKHFASVFQASSEFEPPPLKPLSELPFTFEALLHALQHAPLHKAVAPGTLPNVLIRTLAEPLAQWLWTSLEEMWCSTSCHIPQIWKDAWLCLLAKRTIRKCQDTRPIALTDSLGKIVLGLLTKHIQPYVQPMFRRLPIFAFVPHRGTEEALMHVFKHCRAIRHACTHQATSFWKRHAGFCQAPLAGGALLSLDMSQAFDRLPRQHLLKGFQMTSVPEEIQLLFMHWLHYASYHIHHRGIDASVTSSRGVRQGCKASPMEWTIFLCTLMSTLDRAMPYPAAYSWVKEHLITYADDLIAMWEFATVSDIDMMLDQLCILLDTLSNLGMQVNFDKTVFLMRVQGTQARKALKRLIQHHGNKKWLCIDRPNKAQIRIPVVDTHTYLGTKISYYAFEDTTLTHRLNVGRAAFLRLRAWLLQRHTYPLKLRVQLWLTCVRSSCLHGLQAVGLTPLGAQRLHRRFVSDLRQIARSPSHITKETTLDLFQRLGLPLPLEHLKHLWRQQYESRCHKWEGLCDDDFMKPFEFHQSYLTLMQALDQSMAPAVLTEVQLCPYCDFSTQFRSQLTKHLHRVHKTTPSRNALIMLRDAHAGCPQCAHCGKTFAQFTGFRQHITMDCRPFFDKNKPWQAPIADEPRLQAMARTGCWHDLWADEELLTKVRQQCVLCNQQTCTPKSLAEHLHRHHKPLWEAAQPFMAALTEQTRSHPCRACGQKSTSSHACPVLKQLAMMRAQQTIDHGDKPHRAKSPVVPLSTPMKRQKTKDSAPEPAKTVPEYHPARDLLDGLPQCAHCSSSMHSTHAVQKHIETGACKQFDPHRPVGPHVPCTWPWMLQLAQNQVPMTLIDQPGNLDTLRHRCTLCGIQMNRTRNIIQHLQHDHGSVLDEALAAFPDLLSQLAIHYKCSCACIQPPLDHRCPVHYQAVLMTHLNVTRGPVLTVTMTSQAEQLQAYWHDPAKRAKLSSHCSLCQKPVAITDLEMHLSSHDGLLEQASPLLPLAQSPFMDCCTACLDSACYPTCAQWH